MKSLLKNGLRYVVRFVIVVGVCTLIGLSVGYVLGSGGLGLMAGALLGLCVTLLVPGPARPDGPDRGQHTASTVGRDVGGSSGNF